MPTKEPGGRMTSTVQRLILMDSAMSHGSTQVGACHHADLVDAVGGLRHSEFEIAVPSQPEIAYHVGSASRA